MLLHASAARRCSSHAASVACRRRSPPPSLRRSRVNEPSQLRPAVTSEPSPSFHPAALSLEDEALLLQFYEDKIQQICRSERAKDPSRFTDRVMVSSHNLTLPARVTTRASRPRVFAAVHGAAVCCPDLLQALLPQGLGHGSRPEEDDAGRALPRRQGGRGKGRARTPHRQLSEEAQPRRAGASSRRSQHASVPSSRSADVECPPRARVCPRLS